MKKVLGALVANALSFYLLDLMFNNCLLYTSDAADDVYQV